MRELKFRIWDIKAGEYEDLLDVIGISPDGEWIYFKEPDEPDTFYADTVRKNYIIEQFTGLKDTNGKNIYEGDIISFSIPHFDKSTLGYDGETDLVGKIVFEYDRFVVEDKDGVQYDLYSAEEGEVIGNIHENPELLGGEND